MNLADAIRQAATTNGQPLPTQPAAFETPDSTPSAWPAEASMPKQESIMPEPFNYESPSPQVAGGNVVRLELFLTAEQMSSLFRNVVANQHTVMTQREAAGYLRIPATTLEQMANDGEIPAFQIDGKWRFSRSGLDEWLAVQMQQREREAS